MLEPWIRVLNLPSLSPCEFGEIIVPPGPSLIMGNSKGLELLSQVPLSVQCLSQNRAQEVVSVCIAEIHLRTRQD